VSDKLTMAVDVVAADRGANRRGAGFWQIRS
jgi:hypothetical protein